MLEAWIQWTCDGCGITETEGPNMTKGEVRKMLRDRGWRTYSGDYKGGLDYCPKCVQNGNAKNRVTDMNS